MATPNSQMKNPNQLKPHKNPGNDLKPGYRLRIEGGLVLSLLVLTALMRMPIQPKSEGFAVTLDHQEVVKMEEIEQTEQLAKPPPPPRPPVPVEVPDDVVLDDNMDLNLDASLDINDAVTTLPPPPPEEQAEESEVEPEIFVVVESMPEVIGGIEKVYEYLEYPSIARQAGMEGMVVIRIVVEPTGIPSHPEVARSAGDVLDQAALDAVMKLRFKPGRQRGQPVRVRMAIPIRFKLRKPTTKS